jgi:predicted enzyme related to lactoylglutathione lyase
MQAMRSRLGRRMAAFVRVGRKKALAFSLFAETPSARLRGMDLLINIDVPNLEQGVAFYAQAFGLVVTRRLGAEVVELSGFPAPLYLLQKPSGSIGAGADSRRYDRHWTPLHIDLVVDDIEAALARAIAAGARAETEIRVKSWGKIAVLSDPFGHGFCLIQFLGRGYDEIADHDPRT